MLFKSVLLAGLATSCQKPIDLPADMYLKTENDENLSPVGGRSSSEGNLAQKWQAQRELKASMMQAITDCLVTRRRSMEKKKQEELIQTEWFGAWDSHCSHQIDTACPIKAGECWAMGVITCRKNCDAKFLLRGNRGKFKRCIYKQMKIYEKTNKGTVAENCSIFEN
jgi:hypothetical protein